MQGPGDPKDGTNDIMEAAHLMAEHLPTRLHPLATLAYNYWWSWTRGGDALFHDLDPERWSRCGHNPVRLVQEVTHSRSAAVASSEAYTARLTAFHDQFEREVGQPQTRSPQDASVTAFLCAEFGVHGSLPFYAGGLGILAGDFLKEASDRGTPMVGIGLFYQQGSFHQRLDTSGWQHEYWLETDSDRLPAVVVTASDGTPLTIRVPVHGRTVSVRVWRVDAGRVPLYLLDSDHPDNTPADRWITARLYVGNRDLRLAQYALLGIGGVRALRAMGIPTGLFHLNEGHAALALVELLREELTKGSTLDDATARIREQTRFTTHTPVAAGNEAFGGDQLRAILPGLAEGTGLTWQELLPLGRTRPGDEGEPFGLTPLALRLSGTANGVSQLHGTVARSMWQGLWPDRAVEDVPIAHVTNGVHGRTWIAPEMAALVYRYVPDWQDAPPPDDPAWDALFEIPDDEIWEVRCQLRTRLGALVREQSVTDRLGRGASVSYSESAARMWDENALTIGFARRIATYKRLALVTRQPERGLRLLTGDRPLQLVIAGRAHPLDDGAKHTVQQVFALNDLPNAAGRVVFLEDHDMELAAQLVQGCDLWVNLPRALQEASGTSGMKSVLSGGLQLSVLDGWWAEAYKPGNGWAIEPDPGLSHEEQDHRDAEQLFSLIENEVLPLFYERDSRGIPVDWVSLIKTSMRSHIPRFSATRMLQDYGYSDVRRR